MFVDGRIPAPVDRQFIPLITGFYTCQVVQDFFHQQYVLPLWNGDLWSVVLNENAWENANLVPGFGEPVATEDPEGYYHLSFGGEKTHPKQKTRHVLLWYIYNVYIYIMNINIYIYMNTYLYLRNYMYISMLSLLDTWYSAVTYRLRTCITFSHWLWTYLDNRKSNIIIK